MHEFIRADIQSNPSSTAPLTHMSPYRTPPKALKNDLSPIQSHPRPRQNRGTSTVRLHYFRLAVRCGRSHVNHHHITSHPNRYPRREEINQLINQSLPSINFCPTIQLQPQILKRLNKLKVENETYLGIFDRKEPHHEEAIDTRYLCTYINLSWIGRSETKTWFVSAPMYCLLCFTVSRHSQLVTVWFPR